MRLTEAIISNVCDVLHAHARAIMRARRRAPAGWRVMAEVEVDPATAAARWAGVGAVTPGTGSLLAHRGRGVALFLGANRFASVASVEDAIVQLEDELHLELANQNLAEREAPE